MSLIKVYSAFEDVNVCISLKDLSTIDIDKIRVVCGNVVAQKIEKLKILVSSMNVYEHQNALLINDEYETCDGFDNIAQKFGFNVKPLVLHLDGKNYVLTDPIIDALVAMDESYKIEGLNFEESTDEIKKVISENAVHEQYSKDFLKNLRTLTSGKEITVQGKQEVKTKKDNDRVINVTRGDIMSEDKNVILNKTQAFFDKVQKTVNKNNTYMQEGTAALIENRAKQLGYSVQQTKIENKQRLTLKRVMA